MAAQRPATSSVKRKTTSSINFSVNFGINSLSNVSAFRLYQKKPHDSSFNLVAEFSNPSGVTACSTKGKRGQPPII